MTRTAAESAFLANLENGVTKQAAMELAGMTLHEVRQMDADAITEAVAKGNAKREESREQAEEKRVRAGRNVDRKIEWALDGFGTYAEGARSLGYSSRESTRKMADKGELVTAQTPHGTLVATGPFWCPVDWEWRRDIVQADLVCTCGERVRLVEGTEYSQCPCGQRYRMTPWFEVLEPDPRAPGGGA